MHQINWIRSWTQGSSLEPFSKSYVKLWFYTPAYMDCDDALGVILMGGEL